MYRKKRDLYLPTQPGCNPEDDHLSGGQGTAVPTKKKSTTIHIIYPTVKYLGNRTPKIITVIVIKMELFGL